MNINGLKVINLINERDHGNVISTYPSRAETQIVVENKLLLKFEDIDYQSFGQLLCCGIIKTVT